MPFSFNITLKRSSRYIRYRMYPSQNSGRAAFPHPALYETHYSTIIIRIRWHTLFLWLTGNSRRLSAKIHSSYSSAFDFFYLSNKISSLARYIWISWYLVYCLWCHNNGNNLSGFCLTSELSLTLLRYAYFLSVGAPLYISSQTSSCWFSSLL